MLRKVIIYGAGQLGAEVAHILGCQDDIEVVGFVDDNPDQAGQECEGIEVIGHASLLPRLREEGVSAAIVSIGNNRIRGRIAKRLGEMGFEPINAIHPTANISEKIRIGTGVIICSGAIVCLNAVLGNNIYVGPGAVISHDTSVGDDVLLSVGSVIAGRSDIGSGAFVGAGATVVPARLGKNRLSVGQNAIVGAGAVVLEDVPANAVVVGVPARVVRYREPEEG